MKDYFHELNLIDLLSEKHKALRDKLDENSGNPLNHTETHVIAKLELHGTLSISAISRMINISRQGAQKCVNGLLAEGYAEIAQAAGNGRDKHIALTSKGLETSRKLLECKQDIERNIAEKLGAERVESLKRLLAEDWL
ncbi:MarR family winged helix-turn-helix transcriptional regulator [Paenibacillus tengchongensis]|uniref:MarR family winged helix-turn-helix transcriptional regulator n=1 Tax=Paenibacillus tengchongensis TaxID=2608684 RepID=UPI00124F2D34|nr:MarR family winged helix-turn-helix transcriptional regulator [Paenibacillus tengchongensis]